MLPSGDFKKLAKVGIDNLDAPARGRPCRTGRVGSERGTVARAEGAAHANRRAVSAGGPQQGQAYDPVARFHLGNGARVEQLNWQRHLRKGFDQSWGLMVNYLYDPDAIERNVETFAREQKVAASSAIRKQARR